ncbi:unnamed protein product [Peronospora destructor]|uniref:CCHC-type domain-containing protein n=1 Tax=Peronospora destructor TaxID=86335 RepID=A0AAV0SZF0_9STRA|nr:unnamed protein product [Peronospora destructor]
MDRLNVKFGPRISKSQAFKLFTSKKKGTVSWNDHMLFLMAVSDAIGGANDQVLENIVKYASTSNNFQGVLLARLNPQRDDYLRQAEELVDLAQLNDPSVRLRSKPTVATVKHTDAGQNRSSDDRRAKKPGACFKCGKEGHYKRDCVSNEKNNYTLAVADGIDATHQWILDSGSTRHLVTTASQLYDTEECDEECLLSNGASLRTQLKGKTRFTVRVGSEERRIELIDVY